MKKIFTLICALTAVFATAQAQDVVFTYGGEVLEEGAEVTAQAVDWTEFGMGFMVDSNTPEVLEVKNTGASSTRVSVNVKVVEGDYAKIQWCGITTQCQKLTSPTETRSTTLAAGASTRLNLDTEFHEGEYGVRSVLVTATANGESVSMTFHMENKAPESGNVNVEELAGKYMGELYIALGTPITDTSVPMEGQMVDLMAGATDGTLDFALYNFNFGGTLLGDILLPSIGVNSANGVVNFADNEALDFSFLDGGILATAELNHTTSYIKGDSLVANIDVFWTNAGDENVPIYVLFKGVKLPAVDFAPIAGEYTGKLTIFAEDITTVVEQHEATKMTLSGKDTNTAIFSFGNATLLGTEWTELALSNVLLYDEAANFVFASSENIFTYTSTDQSKMLMSMVSAEDCEISADGLTLAFMLADEADNMYICLYEATLTTPAGIETSVVKSAANAGVYTLGGVRVADEISTRLPKGVYIVNGKKTIIK